jgi:hypothetical protein
VLQQKLEDVSKERDGLGIQIKTLKVVKRKTVTEVESEANPNRGLNLTPMSE